MSNLADVFFNLVGRVLIYKGDNLGEDVYAKSMLSMFHLHMMR